MNMKHGMVWVRRVMIASLIGVVSLSLSGCGKKSETALALAAKEEKPEIEVRTVKVEEREMPSFLRVVGELRSRVNAKVASDGAGKVTKVAVERGSEVKAGDLLVKLDDRSANLALRQAEAQLLQARARLGLAEAEWKRNEPLAKSKAIAGADFEKLSADQESARADEAMAAAKLDSSKKDIGDLEVRAPFDGVVAERLVNVGEFVSAGKEVAQLVSGGSLRLLLQVPETAVGQIKLGQEVQFQVPAYAGVSFSGKLLHIGAVMREATRDLVVEAEVSNEDGRLRQGMFAEGRLSTGTTKRLAVPLNAVKREAGATKVLVVEGERIQERLVDVGDSYDGWTEIYRGLAKESVVVVEPGTDAVDGAKIKMAAVR